MAAGGSGRKEARREGAAEASGGVEEKKKSLFFCCCSFGFFFLFFFSVSCNSVIRIPFSFLLFHARNLKPSRPRRRLLLLSGFARLARSLPLCRRPSSHRAREQQRRPFALRQEENESNHRRRRCRFRSHSATTTSESINHDFLHPHHRHPQRLVPLRRGPRRRAPETHGGLRRRHGRPLEEPGGAR